MRAGHVLERESDLGMLGVEPNDRVVLRDRESDSVLSVQIIELDWP